jgi:hypothetical protein
VHISAGRSPALVVVTADEIAGAAHEHESDHPATQNNAERYEAVRLAQFGQEEQRADAGHGPGEGRYLVEAAEPPPAQVETRGEPCEHLKHHGRSRDDAEPRPVDPAGVEVIPEDERAQQTAGPRQRVGADAPLEEQQCEPSGVHRPLA